ncbi:hypothetical protein AB0953_08705 [Streptomyces sp. NPDC046866]|uniref:hypothetical protein n=1 Tax=Streptomyces sp. NPDC046866 TaxID=3154921 RepID=UPI0034520D03
MDTSTGTSTGTKRVTLCAGGAALVALATVVAGASGAPAAQKPAAAAVHGAAAVRYDYAPADNDIRFTVDAEAAPFTRPFPGPQGAKGSPVDARGKVTVYHSVPGRGVGTSEAEVDCLVTGGRTATLTAIVTKSNIGDVGKRIGISVQDGRHGEPDRLGFSWGIANLDPPHTDGEGDVAKATVGTCMAPAPFTTVVKGGFAVTPAALPPLPDGFGSSATPAAAHRD